jgi:hypothetical protein
MCGSVDVYHYGRSEGRVTDALVLLMRETLAHADPMAPDNG